MNGEDYSLRVPKHCMSRYFRPAINPFGFWMPCDLKAETMYYDNECILGNLRKSSVREIASRNDKIISSSCKCCMPSGQTGNAIFAKLLDDYKFGINFKDQPFF